MEIKIQALKFTASDNQLDFVQKKVQRLERVLPRPDMEVDVTLTFQNDSFKAVLKVGGNIIEKTTDTLENAITAAEDAMREKLVREKEKSGEIR